MRILPDSLLRNSKQKLLETFSKKNVKTSDKSVCMDLICLGYPGYQILEKKSESIRNLDEGLKVYIESLKMTAAFNNLVSLSACQVGLNFKLFVMLKSFKNMNNKFMVEKPLFPINYMSFINPQILEASELKEWGWEECGSFPGLKARILRPVSIKVDYYNEKLDLETNEFHGFPARVFQHELDHLDGISIINLERSHGDYYTEEKNVNEEITEKEKKYFDNLMKVANLMKDNNKMKKGKNKF